MKIVFLVQRVNYYRFYYSIIKEALARGADVECWSYAGADKGKNNLTQKEVHQNNFSPFIHPKTKTYSSADDLNILLIENSSIDFVFTLTRPELDFDEVLLSRVKFRWVVLMGTGPDSFMEFGNPDHHIKKCPAILPRPLYLFIASNYWRQKGEEYLKIFSPEAIDLMGKKHAEIKNVGQPEFDVCVNIDQDKVRLKYGIPKNKKIFLYLPFPYYIHSGGSQWARAFSGPFNKQTNSSKQKTKINLMVNWLINQMKWIYNFFLILADPTARDYWFRGVNETRVITSIKEFCKRNDLYLVVKPRLKWRVADTVEETADLVVWDTEMDQNPSTFKELLSISRLSASYFSHAVLTSIFLNVFYLNIIQPRKAFPESNKSDQDNWLTFWIPRNKPSIFSFDKVCESWSIEDIIEKLPQVKIDSFIIDPNQRAAYVKEFIGFDDHDSCKRILDILANDISKNV